MMMMETEESALLPQSEKHKRPASAAAAEFEEKSQRQRTDYPIDYEGNDPLFDECDSDLDDDENLTVELREVVEPEVFREDLYDEWSEGEGRKCLEHRRCRTDQHSTEFDDAGVLFELFKVKLIVNKKLFTNEEEAANAFGELHGEIATRPGPWDIHNPQPIVYYRATYDDPDHINLIDDSHNNKYATFLLPISGPEPRPAFCYCNTICLLFALKLNGDDVFNDIPDDDDDTLITGHSNPRVFGEGVSAKAVPYVADMFSPLSHPIHGNRIGRVVIGNPETDRILLAAYYTRFSGAWATIDVKMLDADVSSFYGFIVARSCIFSSRIRLLTIQKATVKKKFTIQQGEKGKIDAKTRSIKLTRSFVAVPSYSSLIIGAKLYDERDDQIICCGRVFFPAQESGKETKTITYNGVPALEVKVQWDCKMNVFQPLKLKFNGIAK